MNNERIVYFKKTEETFDIARGIFQNESQKLKDLFYFDVDIQHVGSSVIPGALTQADVDIQIRVNDEHFTQAVEVLNNYANSKHPEIWTDEFAAFTSSSNELQTDYVVTVINSRYDDFYKVRDYLIANPDTLTEYNNLKASYNGKPYAQYSKAKVEFLGGNGKVRFIDY